MARSRLIVPAVCMLILPVGRAPGSAPWPQSAARPGAQVRLAPLHVPGNESPPQPSRPGGIDVTDPNNPVPGFLCSTERKLWVQTKPCPATYAPSSSAGPTAVRQRPLSRQTLCQYLAYGISVASGVTDRPAVKGAEHALAEKPLWWLMPWRKTGRFIFFGAANGPDLRGGGRRLAVSVPSGFPCGLRPECR